MKPAPAPPLALAPEPRRARLVSCYNCHDETLFMPFARQRCASCGVVLNPAPQWVQKHGWPDKPVPDSERQRVHYRAPVSIKKIRFGSPDEHAIARHLESVQNERGVSMNDLLLSIFSDWLEQALDAARDAGADGTQPESQLTAVEASA